MGEARDRHLRSLQGSVNFLDASGAVMRASIDQLAAMIGDLSARIDRLESRESVDDSADIVQLANVVQGHRKDDLQP